MEQDKLEETTATMSIHPTVATTTTTTADVASNSSSSSSPQQQEQRSFPYHMIQSNRTTNMKTTTTTNTDTPSSLSPSSLYECSLTCGPNHNHDDFLMAGFQLISNAQQIQVYLSLPCHTTTTRKNGRNKHNNNGEVEELLLTTVKGIPIAKSRDRKSVV